MCCRVCPFIKPVGKNCVVEKKDNQCCPTISCPPGQSATVVVVVGDKRLDSEDSSHLELWIQIPLRILSTKHVTKHKWRYCCANKPMTQRWCWPSVITQTEYGNCETDALAWREGSGNGERRSSHPGINIHARTQLPTWITPPCGNIITWIHSCARLFLEWICG